MGGAELAGSRGDVHVLLSHGQVVRGPHIQEKVPVVGEVPDLVPDDSVRLHAGPGRLHVSLLRLPQVDIEVSRGIYDDPSGPLPQLLRRQILWQAGKAKVE